MESKKIYYHYCSVETFFNIMQTSTLRLGNPLSMNDYSEVIWFLKLIKNYADKKWIYQNISKKWFLIESIIKDITQEIEFPYILCLSKKNDVLSQWRSYADDGKGVAIGINVDNLLKFSNLLSGNEIIYEPQKQIEIINNKNIDGFLDEIEREFLNNNIKNLHNKVRTLISHLLTEAVVCKNPKFQEEDEYRILCNPVDFNPEERKISRVKFRTNNECILPYREIYFNKIKYSLIENITIGPKSLLNDRNLWLFLKNQGFKWLSEDGKWSKQDKKWKEHVKISKATYR